MLDPRVIPFDQRNKFAVLGAHLGNDADLCEVSAVAGGALAELHSPRIIARQAVDKRQGPCGHREPSVGKGAGEIRVWRDLWPFLRLGRSQAYALAQIVADWDLAHPQSLRRGARAHKRQHSDAGDQQSALGRP